MDFLSSGFLRLVSSDRWAGLLAQADVPTGGSAPAPAADGGASSASGQASPWMNIVFIAGFFAIFYFLVLRPQSAKAKKHKAFIEELKVGSRVVTASGLFGKIVSMEGNEAKIEIADRVVVRVLKSQIAGLETNAAEAVANLTTR